MNEYAIRTDELKRLIPRLKAGDRVLLSGTAHTARDAAHAELFKLLDEGKQPPFDIDGGIIYYAGPTPERPGGRAGSFGPTTSSRMDAFTPRLHDMGLLATIGKGNRGQEVAEAIIRNGAVYFCAIGGTGALIASCIEEQSEIAFPHLGCESVKRLTFRDLPLIVGIDSRGCSLFRE